MESVTNILIGLLVDEVKKGNRTSSTFNKVGWRNVQSELSRQTGFQFTMVQLRNKVNKLKQQYGSFHKLISQSGFGWDNVNKRVVVDDPSIWESHIKVFLNFVVILISLQMSIIKCMIILLKCHYCKNCRIMSSGQDSGRMDFLSILSFVLFLVVHMLLGIMP